MLDDKWANGTKLHYYFFDRATDGERVFFSNGTSEWRPWTTSDVEKALVRQAFQIWKGIGIGLEFLPHVFDSFAQADGSSTRAYGGLGLGLAIVWHLVEAHGGTVSATSAGLGQGSVFTVRLPRDVSSPMLPF